jgi:hypothetical protein
MIDYPDLLDALVGTAQLVCLLLLLFGAYLSTLKPELLAGRSAEEERQPGSPTQGIPRPIWRRSNGIL